MGLRTGLSSASLASRWGAHHTCVFCYVLALPMHVVIVCMRTACDRQSQGTLLLEGEVPALSTFAANKESSICVPKQELDTLLQKLSMSWTTSGDPVL